MINQNIFINKIGDFIVSIKPHLDDTFESITVEFEHNDKTYTIIIADTKDDEFDNMMNDLHKAYIDKEKRKNLN